MSKQFKSPNLNPRENNDVKLTTSHSLAGQMNPKAPSPTRLFAYPFPRFLAPSLLLVLALLSACTTFPTAVPETAAPASPTATATTPPTASPTETPTTIPSPTPTLAPTATPTQGPIGLANLTGVVDLAQAGAGTLGQVAVSPDGHTLAIAGARGVWLYDKFTLEVLTLLTGHAGGVTSVSWAPDGTHLASGGEDTTVRIWDVSQVRENPNAFVQTHFLSGHSKRVTAVSWSSDPTLLASAGEDANVWVWELTQTPQGANEATGKHVFTHATSVYALAWHPGGRYLVTGSLDSTMDLFDALTGDYLFPITGHDSWVTSLAWNATGDILASGATDRTLRLWDVTFQESASRPTTANVEPRAILQTLYNINTLAWPPDSTEIVSAGGNPFTINFWNIDPNSIDENQPELRPATRTLPGHFAPINSLTFAPGGVLISTSSDSTLRFWEARTGKELRRLAPQTAPDPNQPLTSAIQSLAWSPDGTQLVTAQNDYTLRIWDSSTITLTQTRVLTGHQNLVNSVDWSANGRFIASASNDNTTRIWDATTGALLQTVNSESGRVNVVAFSPVGNQVASGGLFRIAQIWEAGTEQTPLLLYPESEITQLAWAPNGTFLAIGQKDGTITIWDIPAAAEIYRLTGGHNNGISGLTWAPNGSQIASLDTGGKVNLWDVRGAIPLASFLNHGVQQFGLSWSPNGALLAVGNNRHILLVDTFSGQMERLLTGHTGNILALEWKPGGGQLASAGTEGVIHLWATAPTPVSPGPGGEGWPPSDNLPAPPASPSAPITLENAATVGQLSMLGHGTALHLASHPSGRYLAVAGGIGTWVYDAKTWEPLRLLSGNKTYAAAWSPDGTLLAARELTTVLVWDVAREQVLRAFGMDIGVTEHLAWSPDGTLLAAGNFRGIVRVFNLATGEVIREWQPGTDITSLAFSPDGHTLAAGGETDTKQGRVWLWDIPSGQPLNILTGHALEVNHLAWSPDGTQLLASDTTPALILWDTTTLALPPVPEVGEDIQFTPLLSQTLTAQELTGIEALAWHPDGSLFMTADSSGEIFLWGAKSGLIQSSVPVAFDGLLESTWLAGTNEILSIVRNGSLVSVLAETAKVITLPPAHFAETRDVVLSLPQNYVIVAHADGTLQTYSLPDGSLLQTDKPDNSLTSLSYFTPTQTLAIRNQEGGVSTWQTEIGEGQAFILSLDTTSNNWRIAYSPTGTYLAWNGLTEAITPTIEVQGITTPTQMVLPGSGSPFSSLTWVPDESKIAAGTEDGKVFIWDAERGRILRTIQAHSVRINTVIWSPDGRFLATGGRDEGGVQFVRLWEATSGRLVREMELPFSHEALSLVWSSDSTMLASGDSLGDILLWDVADGELISTLHGHKQAVIALDWSTDGRVIVSGSRDGTVRVWGIGEE